MESDRPLARSPGPPLLRHGRRHLAGHRRQRPARTRTRGPIHGRLPARQRPDAIREHARSRSSDCACSPTWRGRMSNPASGNGTSGLTMQLVAVRQRERLVAEPDVVCPGCRDVARTSGCRRRSALRAAPAAVRWRHAAPRSPRQAMRRLRHTGRIGRQLALWRGAVGFGSTPLCPVICRISKH